MSGDFDGAEREAAALLEQTLAMNAQALALAVLALVALRHHRAVADSVAFAERGLNAATSGLRWLTTESTLYLVRAEALHALGRAPEAHTAIREARDRILSTAATFDEPGLRTSYLTNIDANGRTLALAKEWLGG